MSERKPPIEASRSFSDGTVRLRGAIKLPDDFTTRRFRALAKKDTTTDAL